MSAHRWKGKSALVCGASAGLGRALAVQLAQAQVARLILLARRTAPLEDLKREIEQLAPAIDVAIESVDLLDSPGIDAAIRKLKIGDRQLDLVIQAVGTSDRGTIEELRAERIHELIDANVVTSLNVIQQFRPKLQSPGGSLVLIGSLASLFAPRYLGGYAVAKHALAALAQQTRMENSDACVHVLLACPGPIAREDAGTRYQDKQAASLPDEALQPGAGAKLQGLEVNRLAQDILSAASRRKCVLIRPRSARFLLALQSVFPSWGDRLLKRKTS